MPWPLSWIFPGLFWRVVTPSAWVGSPLGGGHEDWRSPQSEATLMNADYARTVQLLLAVAPAIFSSPVHQPVGGFCWIIKSPDPRGQTAHASLQ